MNFQIDDITVYFPFPRIYPEQYAYMRSLKSALDAHGPCVLEMPSGTGKTVTLLSFILSYRLARPDCGKLIYCSRTVSEIDKALAEAHVVVEHMKSSGVARAEQLLVLGLTSRRNLCVHPRVREERLARSVDAKCHNLTAPWVRESGAGAELCDFYEQFERTGRSAPALHGVFTLDGMRQFAESRGWCPYFFSRHVLGVADVVIYSYQYVIDPKVANHVSKELPKNSILVFDEAHNIDNVCIDALSVTLDRRTMEASTRNLEKLTATLDRAQQVNADKLRAEYERLLQGMANTGDENAAAVLRAGPTLADDEVREAMPGNMRKAHHFLGALRRLLAHIRQKMRTNVAAIETPLAFQQELRQAIALDAKSLKFCTMRLESLLKTLEVLDVDQYAPLALVADFASLVSTYAHGFLIIIEPFDDRTPTVPDPVLQFCCLDASIAMRPVLERFRSVVITSGTISPLEMYPRILNFVPVLTQRFPMSLTRACILPLIVTRGSDQVAVSTRYEDRGDPAVVRNYGALLVDMCGVVPDGIVCFFPSYFYLEMIVGAWNEMGVLRAALKQKLLFVETSDFTESTFALQNYRKACDNGRGAVLLAVARGKVSEGIDFDDQYGRCVILFGVPYIYTESRVLRARLEFLRDQYQIREGEFLTFDAMRTAAQCIGRVIRGKSDYGIMIFADARYERADKRLKLPQWVQQQLHTSRFSMTTDMCVGVARDFLKQMAQPYTQQDQLGRSLWAREHVLAEQQRERDGINGAPAN
jgi:DNA excision repair protein ERCC-2